MISSHDPVIDRLFQSALLRIPSPRPLQLVRGSTAASRRPILFGAALALLAASVLMFESVEATAASSGFACADVPTKVQVWLASLPRGAEWHVVLIDGVPHLISRNGGDVAVAPAGELVRRGCVQPPTSP